MLKREVARRLKKLIDEKFGGIDRRLAVAAGMQTSTLQSYVEGKSIPGGDSLIKLANAAEVSIDWLLTGKPQSETVNEGPAPYEHGISSEEYEFLALYRGSDEAGREDAKYLLERHQLKTKKKAGQ